MKQDKPSPQRQEQVDKSLNLILKRALSKSTKLRYCSYCDNNTTDNSLCPNCGHQMK